MLCVFMQSLLIGSGALLTMAGSSCSSNYLRVVPVHVVLAAFGIMTEPIA